MNFPSVTKTSSAAISAVPGAVLSVCLTSVGNAASVVLYDNTSGAGTVLCALAVPAAATSVTYSPPGGIPAYTAIYATITGTAPYVTVQYKP